jgi:hypothetical protein
MSDNIVKWLSNYEKWLSHVGAQARGVDRFDRGVSAWLGGGASTRDLCPTWGWSGEPIALVGVMWGWLVWVG